MKSNQSKEICNGITQITNNAKNKTTDIIRKSILVNIQYSKLKTKSVGIIGVGGTGNLIATLLSRAGVGNIIIIDGDIVEETNIERQIIYDKKDIGQKKVECCKEKIKDFCNVVSYDDMLVKENINAFNLKKCDLLIDCTDNLDTRLLLNEFCLKQKIPLLHTGAIKNIGTIFMVSKMIPNTSRNKSLKNSACLSCLYDNKEGKNACNIGVINACVATVSSIASSIAMNYLVFGKIEENMIRINLDTNEFTKIKIKKNKNCKVCK